MDPINPTQHWLSLHQYPALHWHDWDPHAAELFTRKWLADVRHLEITDGVGCNCESKIPILLAKHPVLYRDAYWYSRWANDFHNAVNRSIEKPIVTYDEAAKIFGYPPK